MNHCETEAVIDDRLAWHLENWRDYMRTGGTRELKAPSGAAGCVGGGYSNTFEDMVLHADRQAAGIMDAMIQSLTLVQQAAIHHRYLRAVFRFPRDNYAESLMLACAKLRAGMSGRGLV
jgi:hypothetical protein